LKLLSFILFLRVAFITDMTRRKIGVAGKKV